MSRIAVVIPCYNQGRTVHASVESAFGQTRPPDEVVIVNDGSTDLHTRQVLATASWRERVVTTPNRGLPAARNHGIGLTSADYLVTLDSDDVLEPQYLERTAAVLDGDASVSFVTTAIQAVGEASYVWTPPPCDLVSMLTRGAPHPASLFRRHLWQDVGGFDEDSPLHGIEDLDFWISAVARGFSGRVLAEPLLRYRISSRSMHQRNVASGVHRRAMDALFAKHRQAIAPLGIDLLAAKEAALVDLVQHQRHLQSRKAGIEGQIRDLDGRLQTARGMLHAAGREPIAWGDLRRLTPLSPVWGVDRGRPLDRYYIEGFLGQHRADITGSVLEVKDAGYTRALGHDVHTSGVLDIDRRNSGATLVADLTRPEELPENTFDCFILAQTLPFIYDTRAALAGALRVLKPGGVLLCTVPASGRISYEDDGIDGDFWRFTEASMRRLFADMLPLDRFHVEVHGNLLANVAFLYGFTPDELTKPELDHTDPFFPVIIAVRAVKPPALRPSRSSPIHEQIGAGDPDSGLILVYHRIRGADDHHPDDGPSVSSAHFTMQMEHLRNTWEPLTLAALTRATAAGRIPTRSVAITFDDGGMDSVELVLPILDALGMTATFFLNSERLHEEHERWWDVLRRVLLSNQTVPSSLEIELEGRRRRLNTSTIAGRRAAYDALHKTLLTARLPVRTEVLNQLSAWCGLDLRPRRRHRAPTAAEIRQLAAAGHQIGGHTTHHLALTAQPREVKAAEIAENKGALERLIGGTIETFAYPYGMHDDESVSIVRAAGFSSAVVVSPSAVRPGADLFRLPRLEVGDLDATAFEELLESTVRRGTF